MKLSAYEVDEWQCQRMAMSTEPSQIEQSGLSMTPTSLPNL